MTSREVRQEMFTFRNGLLADMLRKQCALPYRVIFGLNVPQLKAIAAKAGEDAELARELWADTECREARLLGAMVCPPSADALDWLDEVLTVEEADILCHSLLRRCPGAASKAAEALRSSEPLVRYGALRLILNLMPAERQLAERAVAEIEFHPMTDGLVRRLRQEIDDETVDI